MHCIYLTQNLLLFRERDLAEEREDVDDFMRGVHAYLERPAATEKEGALRTEILGYLSLIEDEPRPKREREGGLKPPEMRVGKLAKDVFSPSDSDQGRTENAPNVAVGKLDTSAMFKTATEETKNKPVVAVSKDGCRSVRAALEHKMSEANNNSESVNLKNYTKKRIVDVGFAEMPSKEAKQSNKKTEWKWKNKERYLNDVRVRPNVGTFTPPCPNSRTQQILGKSPSKADVI